MSEALHWHRRLQSGFGLIQSCWLCAQNLERWSKTCSPRIRSTLQEWRTVLDGPLEGVISLLTGSDERAVPPSPIESVCRRFAAKTAKRNSDEVSSA